MKINDDYLDYARLNETRLKRLDKTMKVEESIQIKFRNLKNKYIWLVISESWCGDAAQALPIINKLAEITDSIELKIVFRDENLELMDQFLTNKSRSIPKMIILDNELNEVLGTWGPRPLGAQKFVEDYKSVHGKFDEEGKAGLQMWYAKNKGSEIKEEILEIILELDAKKQGLDLI